MDQAWGEIRRLEELMSFYRPESEISRINREAHRQKVQVGREVFHLLKHAQFLSRLTGGAFDITFAPLWQLWGRCAKEERLPSPAELAQAKGLVDYRRVHLDEGSQQIKLGYSGMKVNLGGIAKGYALSRAEEKLKQAGLDNFLINIGGDTLTAGSGKEGKGWRIGIQHPRKPGQYIGVLRLKDSSSLSSGDYERFFEIKGKRYHHIIDARSGYPASRCSAVTILTPRITRDYLPSVVLFLLGPEKGPDLMKQFPDLAYLIITPEGKVFSSPNFSSFLEGPLPSQLDMIPSD
jgi:thiamine biosynthesis lipoprotein